MVIRRQRVKISLDNQEFPLILWNHKFCHMYKSPLLGSLIRSQINTIHSRGISLRSLEILSSHLLLSLPSGLFPLGKWTSPTNIRVMRAGARSSSFTFYLMQRSKICGAVSYVPHIHSYCAHRQRYLCFTYFINKNPWENIHGFLPFDPGLKNVENPVICK